MLPKAEFSSARARYTLVGRRAVAVRPRGSVAPPPRRFRAWPCFFLGGRLGARRRGIFLGGRDRQRSGRRNRSRGWIGRLRHIRGTEKDQRKNRERSHKPIMKASHNQSNGSRGREGYGLTLQILPHSILYFRGFIRARIPKVAGTRRVPSVGAASAAGFFRSFQRLADGTRRVPATFLPTARIPATLQSRAISAQIGRN